MSAVLTIDLLEVWTDPDTAMEAVGAKLGVFDGEVAKPTKQLATDEHLRNILFDVLLRLVDGGALEMRPCGNGRHAFRWRVDLDGAQAALAAVPVEQQTRPPEVEPETAPPPAAPAPAPEPVPPPGPDPVPAAALPVPVPAVRADVPGVAEISAPAPQPHAPRPITQAPLLVVPALSCLLAVLVYLWFDHAVALVVGSVLLLAGVVGLIRRVPFAGAWTLGIVVAALLVRFS